jgi:hypothetical protein
MSVDFPFLTRPSARTIGYYSSPTGAPEMVLACHLGRYIPPSQATYACYPGRSTAGAAATCGRDRRQDDRVSEISQWDVYQAPLKS